MNKKNNTKLKNSFFGYNLYSSSFAPNIETSISQKHKKRTKNSSSSVPIVKKYDISDEKNSIETIHEESFNSDNVNENNYNSSNREKGKLMSIIFDDQQNNNLNQNNNKINDNMKVMVRIRPPLPREMEFGIPFRSISEVSSDNSMVTILEYMGNSIDELERQHELINNPSIFHHHRFTFDYIFDQDSTQLELCLKEAKPVVLSLLEGYNSSIFAYDRLEQGKLIQ